MSRFRRAFGYFSLGFAVSLLINYWLRQEELRSQLQTRHYTPPPPSPPRPPASPPKPAAKAKAVTPSDDLTQISGIGPKTADLLKAAGISAYADIAAASPRDLLNKLAGARGVNHDKVSAWIKQARKLSS